MSGQQTQSTPSKIPKSSPISGKQGPMKATIPMSSVLKHSSNLGSRNNSAISPTYYYKNRTSPDQSSGQRSPGSSAYKGKSKALADCSVDGSIRRTASLDTIYLKGHWPRDMYYSNMNRIHVDKAIQTDEDESADPNRSHYVSENDEKFDKLVIKPKARSPKDSHSRHGSPGDHALHSSSQTSGLLSPTTKAQPVSIIVRPLHKSPLRNSAEALNKEIEGIVETCGEPHGNRRENQVTPEGHRAPLAELLSSRSVNTQTPQEFGSSHSSGPSSRESMSPLLRMRFMDSPFSETGDSQGSSPDHETGKLGTSPHINKFLAREPPDGCERVSLQVADKRKIVPRQLVPPPSNFKLKPSLGSAFHQIRQPNTSNTVEQDLPLVPPEEELN